MSLMQSLLPPANEKEEPVRRFGRRWSDKFRAALRGIKVGIRGHSSFAVHFFVTALVLIAAFVLNCDRVEWCILIGCIGLVLVAELFNSSIETLFRGLDDATKERTWPALDVAAGAVLMASIAASIVGAIVFLTKLLAKAP
jgi:diacylglycerol kinase